jgi:DNA-binding MarR family transcriptional regulator
MRQHLFMSKPPRARGLPSLGCACANLRRAGRAVTQLYDEALRPVGLRATQLTLLQVLARMGPVTQGVLGEALASDSTTLSRTLKPLEAARWIRSFPGGDRRERHLELTPAGRRVLERATPAWEAIQHRLRDHMGERDWRALETLTTAVVRAARQSG